MPNWVHTRIVFNSSEDLNKALNTIQENYKNFFRNKKEAEWIMPENEKFSFNYIIPEPLKEEDCPEEFKVNSDSHIVCDDNRTWFDWYAWHNAKWNTKWDACDVSIDDNEIYFDTAWSFAEPVMEEFAQICLKNKISFDGAYAEEQGPLYTGRFATSEFWSGNEDESALELGEHCEDMEAYAICNDFGWDYQEIDGEMVEASAEEENIWYDNDNTPHYFDFDQDFWAEEHAFDVFKQFKNNEAFTKKFKKRNNKLYKELVNKCSDIME